METIRWQKRMNVFSLNVIFITIGIALMIAYDLFGLEYVGYGYVDEIFCLICLLSLFMNALMPKRMPKYFFYLLAALIALLFLGFLGNLFSGVQTDFLVIAEDAFIFCKPYILFLYVITTVKEHQVKMIYDYFTVICKILIIIIFFFSVASLIFGWNMQNSKGEFSFLSKIGFTGIPAMWTVLLLAVIVSNKNNNRFLYYILSAIVIFMTNSGLGKLSIVGLLAIYLFLEKRKKFKWYYLLMIIPICLWVGRSEISGYLMNPNAPRFLLFYYSFVTAFKYFPFGSGFATYASTMAAKVYSKLYYVYGFNQRYGMDYNSRSFLMDSYYPQIVGQFGIFGVILFGYFMFVILKKIILRIRNRYIRNASLYLFATWAIAGLGFGISGLWGCMVYLVLALLYLMDVRMSNLKNISQNVD